MSAMLPKSGQGHEAQGLALLMSASDRLSAPSTKAQPFGTWEEPALTSLNTRCSRSSSSGCAREDTLSTVYFHSSCFSPSVSIL